MGNTHRKAAWDAVEGGDTAGRAASHDEGGGRGGCCPAPEFERHTSDLGEHRLMNLPTAQGLPISPELASGMVRASSVPITMHLSWWIDGLEMPDKNTMEECLRCQSSRAPTEELLRVPAPRTETCLSSSGSSSSSHFRKEIEAHCSRERERCCVENDELSYAHLDLGIMQLEANCAC